MEGASGIQNLGSERETWVDEEVEALLDVWGDTYIHVKRENLGKRHWETVVREVNSRLSHQREQPQMKNKIDSLKKRYKREKLSKGDSDRNLITWKWYDRCDMLWGIPKRDRGLGCIDGQSEMMHQENNRIIPFLPAMHPDVNDNHGVKAARMDTRMDNDGGGHEGSPPAEASSPPPPPCSKCRNNSGVDNGGKENVKRRKFGSSVAGKNIAALIQGFAETYSRVEQAKMEMTMAIEERRLQFLERMEQHRLEIEEKHMERKAKMEEKRLEMQEKHLEQKLEMQEKHLERHEILKLEIMRLRLQVLGPKSKPHEGEQQQAAQQTCEKFSSSNITTCM